MKNNFLIYKFTSPSGKSYIGQTNNLKRRVEEHKLRGKCRAFNAAINKHGFENFTQEILKENLTIEEANYWEVLLIKEHVTLSPNGYNLRTGGYSSIPSSETREIMSAWQVGRKRPEIAEKTRAFHTGRKASPEACAKMTASRIGKKASIETRAKMSVAQKGLKKPPCSDERRKKTSEQFKGIPKTAEQREKMSEAAKKRHPVSEETRKKMSDAAKLRSKRPLASSETRAKISAAKANPSTETREKISENNRRRHAKRKAEGATINKDEYGRFASSAC
ncbi:MAG: GIY-YIG nuclease family protein [Methylobacter sp.]|jgi:group I intron endonuclease|nr:GIY-YIG nuclease family protein [Methylobacter sp.]